VGVAGQIVPWNYPLMMTTWKLAPALAAGCSIVLKPDSATPLSALRMAELGGEVGFPPGAVNVVPGPGKKVGAHLVRHPGVDKIAVTGSTATGGEIMRLASDPIKRITLELGGKSPNVVFADADLEDAIPSAVWSIYYSAGQSCEARSRMLVERSIYDDFVARFSDAAGRLRVGDPLEPETGRLADLDRAPRQGARLRRAGARRGRRDRARRRGRRRPRGVLSADRARRRRQPDGRRAGGDLRARRDRDSVRGREGRDPNRE
jgi:acyl-CoA reductase-like NAD-dependent aldehyde dehydrogenase